MKRILTYTLAFFFAFSCSVPEGKFVATGPDIYPDYRDVTVPENIAPLNFSVIGADRVSFVASNGSESVSGRGKYAKFPISKWHSLVKGANELTVCVSARIDGKWRRYKPFVINVSSDSIDRTIVYRRLDPGYELYSKMGIYQRDLGGFREKPVYRNDKVAPGCMNCHSFAKCDPSTSQLHLRGRNGGTLISRNGEQLVLDMKNPLTLGTVYPYWHPEGRYIAYSTNDIRQSFHNRSDRILEVYDLKSDVVVFDTRENEVLVYPALQDSTKMETFPAFSADGKTLYFCRADAGSDFMNIHYELCSVGFDSQKAGIDNDIRTVWSREGKSVSFPRPSYDGKYLLFTVCDFGNFTIWHQEAQLWCLNLQTGECREAVELNSDDAESYHSWSSDSHWVVFSSRRDDGRHTRLYFSKILDDGSFTKPFMLPQKDPGYNTLLLQSYNIPEFCNAPYRVSRKLIESGNREGITARFVN